MPWSAGKCIPPNAPMIRLEANLEKRISNLNRQVRDKPMQPRVVVSAPFQIVDDHPSRTSEPSNHAMVGNPLILVAIILSFEGVHNSTTSRRVDAARSLRPVDPQKPAGPAHLIPLIDHDGVMNGCPSKAIIPRDLAVVEVRSRIPRKIGAFPPQIEVQLIGLEGAATISSSTDHRPGVVISQTEIACLGGYLGARIGFASGVRLETKPQCSLVPSSRSLSGSVHDRGT